VVDEEILPQGILAVAVVVVAVVIGDTAVTVSVEAPAVVGTVAAAVG
jgi:hypothetical protein